MSATSSDATASLSTASVVTSITASVSGLTKESLKRVDPGDIAKKFLACGLCNDLYENPKLLPCLHSFCKRCLAFYIPDHSLSLACPICRQHSILPVAGVSALRDNGLLTQLLKDIGKFRRRRSTTEKESDSCIDGAAKDENSDMNEEQSGDTVSHSREHSPDVFEERSANSLHSVESVDLIKMAKCLQHESSDLTHFCVECDTVICLECIDAEHREHSVQKLDEFSAMEKTSLTKILSETRECTKSVDTSLRNIAKTKLKLEREKTAAEETVDKCFASLKEALERKRETLLSEIDVACCLKTKKLDEQEGEIMSLKRTVEACCDFMESCLDSSTSLVGLILARKELSERLEQFCRSNVQLMPDDNPFVIFQPGKLPALTGLIEESLKASKDSPKSQETSPLVRPRCSADNVPVKSKQNELKKIGSKYEKLQKERKTINKIVKMNAKAGDSADSEASSDSSSSSGLSLGPLDIGTVVSNSAVSYETVASGENLKRCFLNVSANIVVTTKTSKGVNVNKGGAKLSSKIYTLEAGFKNKIEKNNSEDGGTSFKKNKRNSSGETLSPCRTLLNGKKEPSDEPEVTEGHPTGSVHKVSFSPKHAEKVSRRSPDTPKDDDEGLVTIDRMEDVKEKTVYKKTLLLPDILDVGDGTYELSFTVTENVLKRHIHNIHSTLDVSRASTTSGRLTPQSPLHSHKEFHSSLDKLQQKKRPKSAPEIPDLLETVQLEIKLYGQQIKGSPFTIKVKKEVPKLQKDAKNLSSTVLSHSRHSAEYNRRHSGSGTAKRTSLQNVKPSSAAGNRKPSSASASHNDGPCQRIGTKGHNKGEFMNLQGIAVHGERILVADSNGQCVQVFSMDGRCLLKFGAKGRSPGQMQRPTGVACTPDGEHILVSDYENKWVGVYTNEGRFVSRIGHGKLAGPKGVTMDKQGRVIIVDNRSSTVWLYTLSGKILGKFGARGVSISSGSSSPSTSSPSGFVSSTEAFARLAGPHFCAIDQEDGDVVVTDFHNHRVKVFSSDGQYKFSFGSAGDGNGQFSAPTGVCVDKQGNILVADWGNSRVQIFDKHGSFLSHIDTSSDPLYGPQGLTITDENSVIVADSGNHCLKVYKHLFI